MEAVVGAVVVGPGRDRAPIDIFILHPEGRTSEVQRRQMTTVLAPNVQNIADMENWMRVFAANHAAGNWDSYGAQNGQNMYAYIGALGTKWSCSTSEGSTTGSTT